MARKWPDWVYMYYLEFVITLSWVIPVILYIYIARSDNLAHAGSKENSHINFATKKIITCMHSAKNWHRIVWEMHEVSCVVTYESVSL